MEACSIVLGELNVPTLSDQGSTLRSVFTEYQMEHLISLRDLLVQVKREPHGFQGANLLRCKSQKGFDGLLELFPPEPTSAPGDLTVNLTQILAKVGLEI
jgi:hypothetical protein